MLQVSHKTLMCVLQVLREKLTHEQMQAMPAVTSLAEMRQRQHVVFAQPRFEMGWAAAEVRHLHRFLRFSASEEDVMWASSGECKRCCIAGQPWNARCHLQDAGCFLHSRNHHEAGQPPEEIMQDAACPSWASLVLKAARPHSFTSCRGTDSSRAPEAGQGSAHCIWQN